ncbi:hypothetical protein AWC23_16510 [Mycobacterium saskatchewanense]|uniref:Uncharacterized protein n=2 Tax=Mycobacterium saskatchewanense TaxID=220927 RepID=A0AAJ3NNL2_9MYCO|nr:hypothetical protein AWC23_16510 [Mycobacterium saskatchewanense]
MEYQSTYKMTRNMNPHSYVGPKMLTPRQLWSCYRAIRAFAGGRPDLANTVPGLIVQARRTLPRAAPSAVTAPSAFSAA